MYSTDYKELLRMAYRNKGLSLFLSGSPSEARLYFDKALTLDPKDYKAMLHKANALSSMKHFEEAIKLYEKVIEELEGDYGK